MCVFKVVFLVKHAWNFQLSLLSFCLPFYAMEAALVHYICYFSMFFLDCRPNSSINIHFVYYCKIDFSIFIVGLF